MVKEGILILQRDKSTFCDKADRFGVVVTLTTEAKTVILVDLSIGGEDKQRVTGVMDMESNDIRLESSTWIKLLGVVGFGRQRIALCGEAWRLTSSGELQMVDDDKVNIYLPELFCSVNGLAFSIEFRNW